MAKSEDEKDIEAELLERDHQAFMRMAMTAVAANLWNSSEGRDPKKTARTAHMAAEALWLEWRKHQK